MFEQLMEDFSMYVHTHYYTNVPVSDWGVNNLHKTSIAFGYKPHLLGQDISDSHFEDYKALFMVIWNEHDRMLYINMERYFAEDIEKFPQIYQDLLGFLQERNFDCLVSVFCYDHYSTIPDMEKPVPLSFTGDKSKAIYRVLEQIPTFKEDTPVLHINFDGVQYNDWDSTFYTLSIKMDETPQVEVFSIDGEKVVSLEKSEEAKKFVKEFLS